MDQEVRGTLLHHLRRNLALTFRKLLNIVGGQGDHVRDARHRGGHGQGQAQHCTGRQRQGTPHEEVQVVAGGLLKVVGRSVHNHAGEVLIQVAQHRETNGRQDRIGNAPGRELPLDARWVHNPAPLASPLQLKGRGKVCLHLQRSQARVAGIDGTQGRSRHEGDGHGEVCHQVSDGPQHPWGAPEVRQLRGSTEGVDEEQRLKHGVGQGHLLVREVPDHGRHTIDDEDQADEACEDVLAEHGHMLHQGAQVKNRHQDREESAPHADPEIIRHELQAHALCHVVAHQGVSQERPCGPQDRQRLSSKCGEEHATDGG
mmetsp:Transcript_49253/g.88571  ORF Transcript_49253/g.88571 Transcript_49253/m.88571 type:complete len:315 (-) Transcript_49253:399-1343(-)